MYFRSGTYGQNATIVRCSLCQYYISELNYDLHTQAAHHRATVEQLQDRIDFKTLQIFPSSLYNTTTEFLHGIHNDFTILMDHLLLKYTTVFVDFSITVLFQEKSSVEGGNNNINAIKQFYVHRQVIISFVHSFLFLFYVYFTLPTQYFRN